MNFDLTEERRQSNEELRAERLEAGSAFLFYDYTTALHHVTAGYLIAHKDNCKRIG